MSILDGRQVKIQILKELKEKLLKLNESIGLVVIQIGDDAASSVYVRQKNKMATDLNYKFQHIKLPSNIKEDELLKIIENLNNDDVVDGILVQMPIPKHLDANKVQNSILSCIKEEQVTIIFIKNNEYFDVTSMEILSDEYNISNLEPLSKYATENDFELEESEEGLVFSLEENILEKYLKEIEK